jgi:hypothetical protein
MGACKPLITKHFHGVSSGNKPPHLLKSRYGKDSSFDVFGKAHIKGGSHGKAVRIEYPGAFCHVTSRGNEQKDVFKSQKDRELLLSYMESAVVRYRTVVHIWCLMRNHYTFM